MKKDREWHVANVKKYPQAGDSHVSYENMGCGNYYGRGVRQPMGKIIRASGLNPATPKQLKTPPRGLA